MDVFITGMGIISSLGNNCEENYKSLIDKKDGVSQIENLNTIHKNKIPVAEIKLSNSLLKEKISNLNSEETYTRTALLGITAAEEAIQNAKITDINDCKTYLMSATTVAGMSDSENFYKQYRDTDFSNEYIETHDAGDSTQKIADSLGIKNMTTISTACSSAANAIMFGCRLIKNGYADRVVAGGTDALSKFTLNGFNTLMILDSEKCQPFDKSRRGLNLGEAAAFLVLESENAFKKRNIKPIAKVSGYANANDAFHQTASSPNGQGAYLAMKNALKISDLNPEDISYINAHGTGTENNDQTESVALKRIFGENVPAFSSTKAYTGHTLAAAGSVEAVISLFSIKNNIIFPNLRFETPIEETNLVPVKDIVNSKEISHCMSNSFGFGGNCTTLIFSKI